MSAFVDRHELETPPEFRLLDLVSELGEVAKEVTESTDYGDDPDRLRIEPDEIGDVLFALLALAESVDVDANEALDAALSKYETRLDETGNPASGE